MGTGGALRPSVRPSMIQLRSRSGHASLTFAAADSWPLRMRAGEKGSLFDEAVITSVLRTIHPMVSSFHLFPEYTAYRAISSDLKMGRRRVIWFFACIPLGRILYSNGQADEGRSKDHGRTQSGQRTALGPIALAPSLPGSLEGELDAHAIPFGELQKLP